MKEGLIIKLYRERAGLTQTQLGEGICSVTHISKIERGITQYSSEIISLICGRLNIDLNQEMEQYELLEKKLHEWLEVMVKQQLGELETLKEEIENNAYIHLSEVQNSYRILLARYLLTKGNMQKGKEILDSCQQQLGLLDRYEKHLLEHTLGIFYINIGKIKEAIRHLTNINPIEYNNHEFYYHLASAYHMIQAKVKAYHYGNLALSYFRTTNNFKRMLDTETLMLIQMGYNDVYHFEDTVERYHALIKSCKTYQEDVKVVNLWHNLGVDFAAKHLYEEARVAYEKALEGCLMHSLPHIELGARRGIVHCSIHLGDTEKTVLRNHIQLGRKLAKRLNNETYLLVFHLLEIMLIHSQSEAYYHYLETTFLPHLQETGQESLLMIYEKEIFHYYRKSSQYEKAAELADKYMSASL
ncbi:helix-turn-helix transcriptional regulator [Fictibacillus sp. b24]|uniref:helix-turn-helix domain-containing protein n=1 Tax=Fictibacillus sp. b24 TaxID=3055863 RepID=UPI0025A0F5EE|nr:helix-turn-helix transcriptional regulator [Fictibacillus sp. b24]MDM5317067.1 helix-turn-helix transcriptional regulator [Fictibacillus sp. b24]